MNKRLKPIALAIIGVLLVLFIPQVFGSPYGLIKGVVGEMFQLGGTLGGYLCIILAIIGGIRSFVSNKKKITPNKVSLNELISELSNVILLATLVGWTESDFVNKTCSATRYKKDIYSVAGMVYLTEHMISRNVNDKIKIENFANKLLSKVADEFAEKMCKNGTTRSDKAKVSNLVKKAYFYFWDKKEASENSPKGVTDAIIEKLCMLDNSLDKNELEDKLGKHLVSGGYADFANIASHLINNPNMNDDHHL